MYQGLKKPVNMYDKLCLNNECIAKKEAFYRHMEKKNEHLNHQTVSIHAQDISNILKIQQNTIFTENFITNIEQEIKNTINLSCYRLAEQIYSSLFEAKVRKYVTQSYIIGSLNVQSLQAKLRTGNYLMLALIKCFQNNSVSFIENKIKTGFLNKQNQLQQMMRCVDNKLKTLNDEFLRQREHFYPFASTVQLEDILSKLIPQNQIQNQYSFPLAKRQEPVLQNFFPNKRLMSVQEKKMDIQRENIYIITQEKESIQKIGFATSEVKIQADEEGVAEKQKKRKLIRKEQRPSQLVRQQSKSVKSILKITGEMTSRRWAQLLKDEKSRQIIQVQILNEQYTTHEKVFCMLNAFPKLKYLSFNCCFKIHQQAPSVQLLSKLQNITIDFKWDLPSYMIRYISIQYFSHKKIYQRQTIINKFNLNLFQMILAMKNSKSLWIYQSKILLPELIQRNFNFSNLMTLNISCQFCSKTFSKLKRIKELRTLILKGVKFDKKKQENNLQLGEFIKNNPHISTFILGQTKILPSTLHNVLTSLKTLENFKNLTIQLFEPSLVDSQVIFNYPRLQTLHLNTIQFSNSNLNNCEPQKLTCISNLKLLCLYICEKLPRQMLKQLCRKNRKTLTHLQIGACDQFNDDWLQIITPLTQLNRLGLDQTKITGKQLVKCLKQLTKNKDDQNDLSYLGIDKLSKPPYPQITLQDLQALSSILPNLKCLNIEYQYGLCEYDFRNFKDLKIIIADQKLNQKLKQKKYPDISIATRKVMQK